MRAGVTGVKVADRRVAELLGREGPAGRRRLGWRPIEGLDEDRVRRHADPDLDRIRLDVRLLPV
jgi:hypothetical protein